MLNRVRIIYIVRSYCLTEEKLNTLYTEFLRKCFMHHFQGMVSVSLYSQFICVKIVILISATVRAFAAVSIHRCYGVLPICGYYAVAICSILCLF